MSPLDSRGGSAYYYAVGAAPSTFTAHILRTDKKFIVLLLLSRLGLLSLKTPRY